MPTHYLIYAGGALLACWALREAWLTCQHRSRDYVSPETLAGLRSSSDAEARERALLDERAPSRPRPEPSRIRRLLAFVRPVGSR